jgi:hypothetical protein
VGRVPPGRSGGFQPVCPTAGVLQRGQSRCGAPHLDWQVARTGLGIAGDEISSKGADASAAGCQSSEFKRALRNCAWLQSLPLVQNLA